MKKQKNIPIIVILVICVLGLSSFIIYDKVLNEDKNKVVNMNDEFIDTPQEFINKITKTEEELKNKKEYTVNYKDFQFTVYKNEYNNISNIVIKNKGKQINKDLSKITDTGFHTLNSYYFDEETGLFILTLIITPVADSPSTYIIAFDIDGNIKLDEEVEYNIYVDENQSTLLYHYYFGGGVSCNYKEIKYSSVTTYKYSNRNELTEMFTLEKTMEELPECK